MKNTSPSKKNVRQRGRSSHGWGHKKKHRGKGSRGGKGNAGTGKRADTKKPTIVNLYGNSYLGREKGFHVPNKVRVMVINLRDLNVLYENGTITKAIDLSALGYGKLLATGKLLYPLHITVGTASARAIEKVKSAGGDVILSEAETAQG